MTRLDVSEFRTNLLLMAARPVGFMDWELQEPFLVRETKLQTLADVTCVLTRLARIGNVNP